MSSAEKTLEEKVEALFDSAIEPKLLEHLKQEVGNLIKADRAARAKREKELAKKLIGYAAGLDHAKNERGEGSIRYDSITVSDIAASLRALAHDLEAASSDGEGAT